MIYLFFISITIFFSQTDLQELTGNICFNKKTFILGNGPSAITLSYMLAGNWPYYNDLPHPIDFLQNRLEENKEYSLLEQVI